MLTAIGLMSGTSLDGVDVALIETDGERIGKFGPSGFLAYSNDERALLREAFADAVTMTDRSARPGALARAEELVTRTHAQAVAAFLKQHAIDPTTVDAVGFHGQTVLHRPQQRLTVQIGNAQSLAKSLGIPVVHDFRAADVAAGGQGAPLVPVYHRALVHMARLEGPSVVVNIGGVANISYVHGYDLIACDTGTGNALLDDFMLKMTGHAVDQDGRAAAKGHADKAWIAAALDNPFFRKLPPKSLDRNAFAALSIEGKSVEDGAATLTEFTAANIALVTKLLPQPPLRWIVVGGGANNPTLIRVLGDMLPSSSVMRGSDFGWNVDAVEAQAFAYLAVRSIKALPLTFPGTTGVPKPMTGGLLAKP